MLVIFDWDGTLCDSAPEIVMAMQDAAREHRLTVPGAAAVREIIGLSLPLAIARIFPGLSEDRVAALAESYSVHFRAHASESRLYEGARETLEALALRGFQLAVATGKSRRGLDRVLGELGMQSLFHATRCADETRSKPDPLMLEELLQECGREPAEALMVGDTEYDLEMANAAKAGGLGVDYGVHSRERLLACSPLGCLSSVNEIPTWLEERLEKNASIA